MRQPIDRLRAALTDPARRERSVLLALAVYSVLWTVYGTIAKSEPGPASRYDRTARLVAHLAWGYKHPPLAAALVRLWFSVFPIAAWSYYLLAMLMPTLTLWIVWRLSADYLDIEKRVFGLALLTLVPFFNFHALKFNVNTVLMPAWAATTLWFLRSYATRSTLYAALAGVGAAAAMLGKYWSVFLIAGLVAAALIDSRRAAYFRSAAPWITVAVGLIVIAPHLVWLYQHHFEPFIRHPDDRHGDVQVAAGLLELFPATAGEPAVPGVKRGGDAFDAAERPDQRGRSLLPHPRHARQPVARVTAQRGEVGVRAAWDVVLGADRGLVDHVQVEQAADGIDDADAAGVVDQLEQVPVAGHHVDRVRRAGGQGADHVVGLEPRLPGDDQPGRQ